MEVQSGYHNHGCFAVACTGAEACCLCLVITEMLNRLGTRDADFYSVSREVNDQASLCSCKQRILNMITAGRKSILFPVVTSVAIRVDLLYLVGCKNNVFGFNVPLVHCLIGHQMSCDRQVRRMQAEI